MKNLDKVMKWEDAVTEFTETHLPSLRRLERVNGRGQGEVDGPMRREAWNNWTDMLCKSGVISDWQYENWSQPECCEKEPRW